jgi:hypothetical protein
MISARSGFAIVIAIALVFFGVVLTVPVVRVKTRDTARAVGLGTVWDRANAAWKPVPRVEMLPSGRATARRHTVSALHTALRHNDFESAALINSILAQEAFARTHRTLKFWQDRRDTETRLLPIGLNFTEAFWNGKDTGADLFGHLLVSSTYVDPDSEALWLDTLMSERELCGAMPCTVYFKPPTVVRESRTATVFGASEYAKDGLLAVAERLGPGPWFTRLEEIANAIIAAAHVVTPAGRIPASDTEVNGNMLQVLTRIHWATGHRPALEMAERIAEAYLFEVLPANGYLPATHWNFAKHAPATDRFSLRDHGSEIIAGLSELYFLEKLKGLPNAQRYRDPLRRFYDRMLQVGRTEDGLWHNVVDIKTGTVVDNSIVDTWGYVLNALHTFDLAEGTSTYATEIRRVMRAAARRKSFHWEPMPQDGHADAIESMLYLMPWFDDPEYRAWIDDEMEVLFHMQSPAGSATSGYLDGNFNRTALLYAMYKTKGTRVLPWRQDVMLGAAHDREGRRLYVHLSAGAAWRGLLKFDTPRHRDIWNLPFEYPRLNGLPQWFVVEPDKEYVVKDLGSGRQVVESGAVLATGLQIALPEGRGSVRLEISEASAAGELR